MNSTLESALKMLHSASHMLLVVMFGLMLFVLLQNPSSAARGDESYDDDFQLRRLVQNYGKKFKIKPSDLRREANPIKVKQYGGKYGCNLRISVTNEGAFSARLRIGYSIEGVSQPHYVSETLSLISQTTSFKVPDCADDLVVYVDGLGFTWFQILRDAGINRNNTCFKCYKVGFFKK